MKKNVLALSIAAMIGGLGFAGAASAQVADTLQVNESGTGHMLLVPYYTAQNGNMTVFHVVNTDTSNGKAMKVRFRGASNSDDVLDFQVFMSPGDVWTAAVVKGADDVASLVTSDGTCTLPAIAKNTPVSFVQDRLPAAMTAADKASNTREGYVEIFNMADITDTASTGDLYDAIKHKNGVAPCTDSVLQATLTTGAGTAGLAVPTSGLLGSWYIMNVPQTTTFAGSATAILAVTPAGTPAVTRNVFSPQANGAATLASADPLFKSGIIAAQQYDVPDLSTPYLNATPVTQTGADLQATALVTALAKTAVLNQYANDSVVSAKTDWVFSMPTRRYAIAANYAAASTATVANTQTATKATTYRVINEGVSNSIFANSANTNVNSIGQICASSIGATFFDREETSRVQGAVFSPGTVTNTPLCGEVSVLSFADSGASVLGATVARSNVTGVYQNGWGRIAFGGNVPMLGSAFIKLTNPNVGAGMSGTYGITWPHAHK